MNSKMLILGATGNIGSFLVQNLQRKQADFIAGVPSGELAKVEKMKAQAVALDFDDPSSLDNAMKGINSLFLLLPLAEQMIGWGKNIIDAAKRNGVQFILRSSLIDARPDSPYFFFNVHGIIDHMLRSSGIPYAIVHPNSFMQNYAVYYAGSINKSNAFSFVQGDYGISYVDVRDIAAVDAEILANPAAHHGMEYTVTGPAALYYDEIAERLSAAAGRLIRFIPVDEVHYEEELRGMGASDWAVSANLSLQRHINDGKQAVVTSDVTNVTGKAPGTFEQFVRDYAPAWMQKKVPVEA